ncbi:DUF3387 domain-containing protein [Adhaeribacter sp. BT258]|uniref:DUF3387 domain-containing protein n=2 Tax=Adhaeribacter terrigena TaxID=2793070 RepID=A0ABS1C0V7_9BACT|nr:DUF3387 domain-containing protein [Adhaeribacter terrigena]
MLTGATENRNNVQTPLWSPQGDSLVNDEKQETGAAAKSPFGGGRGRTSRIPKNPDNGKILPPTPSEGGQTGNASQENEQGTFSGQNPTVFKYQNWPYLSKGDKLKLVWDTANFFVSDDTVCKTFMLNEKKLSSLVPVIKNHERVKEIALEIIFFQHVGAAVRKVKFPTTNIRKKEGQIKELIHRSIESEDVVDVFEMAGIERFDISIINDDFLATAKEKKSGNELKLELIRQILNDEIKVRVSRNLVKYRKLKEEVEKIIQDYHNHFFDSLIALQKLRDVAREMQEEDQRRQQLGLTEEEEAFYEILAKHQTAQQDFELIKQLVKELTALIKKNVAQPDWYKKPDTKAQIMLSVKSMLRRKGVGAELQEILNEIMEQAEERYKEWNYEVA